MVTLFDSRRIDKVSTFARGLLPECDEFGNKLAVADFSAADASWKAEVDLANDPDARFVVEYVASLNGYGAGREFCVDDRAHDVIESTHKTRAEAELAAQRAEDEARLEEMCSSPEFARWARSLHEYEEQEITEARISA
jgi:hypothetical protein